MSEAPNEIQMQEAQDELIRKACLARSPDWLDIPEKYEQKIREQVKKRIRMFWMEVGDKIERNVTTETLLLRAIYAEIRSYVMEDKVAEMAIVVKNLMKADEKARGKSDIITLDKL